MMRALADRRGGSLRCCCAWRWSWRAAPSRVARTAKPSRARAGLRDGRGDREPQPRSEVLDRLRHLVRRRARRAHARRAASASIRSKMTAAHRSLPFGTWVDVTRVDTGPDRARAHHRSRAPFGHQERIIDLSHEAAKELGILKAGVTRVKVTQSVDGP